MINFYVETKYEYTTQLVNVLTSLIYEGLNSIYTEALKTSNGADNILKVFQSFLRRIPKWNSEIIKQESDRILTNTKSVSWLSDLVKATLKANMIILTFNPSLKLQHKIDPKYYKDIKLEDFIHKIYIECARELWNNPYLMYHQYSAIELKRNQRDTITLIKEAIKEAVRKLLPLKEILEIYLDDELEINNVNDFDKNVSEIDERNIQKLINKDLKEEFFSKQYILPNQKLVDLKQQGGDNMNTNTSNDSNLKSEINLNSKILNIINNDKSNEYFSPKKLTGVKPSDNDINKSSSDTPMTKATRTLSNTSDSDIKSENINQVKITRGNIDSDIKSENINQVKIIGENVDDKIKKILENDLGVSDLETSLSYHAETNDKDYQEIFANSIVPQLAKNQNKTGGNSIKESSKNKRKFFNNYLNI
jgi:hypothetical protein